MGDFILLSLFYVIMNWPSWYLYCSCNHLKAINWTIFIQSNNLPPQKAWFMWSASLITEFWPGWASPADCAGSLMSSRNLYLIFLRSILWFSPSTNMYPHTNKNKAHARSPYLSTKTHQSSEIRTTSFCSQTKSLKANRCFLVITASYHSRLPLIRLYFLTQMLRSSIYQMHQKSGQGGGGMSEHRKYPQAWEMRRNMALFFFFVGLVLFLKRR